MIRVQYNGRKEKATGYSCKPNEWDKDNHVLIKKYPNSETINLQLKDLMNRAEAIKYEFERKKEPYTPVMIFDELFEERTENNELDVYVIIERYIQTQNLKYSTKVRYKNLVKKLKEFFEGKQVLISSIDKETILKFDMWISQKGYNDNYIIEIYSSFNAVINYAIDLDLIGKNVLNQTKVKRKHKSTNKKLAISQSQIILLHDYYLNLIGYNFGSYYGSYYAEFSYSLRNKSTALALFLFSYFCQGLAFCDIAKLKVSDIKHIKRKNEDSNSEDKYIDYIQINTTRSKTNISVCIVVKNGVYDLFHAVITPFLESAQSRDNYLFPIFQNKEKTLKNDTEEDIYNLLKSSEKYVNITLKKIAKEADVYDTENCKKYHKQKIDNLPENLKFYAARHTFATVCIQLGISPYIVAQLMGRSMDGMYRYIKSLEGEDMIITVKKDFEKLHNK
jgi:site-specific recombinase XerD